MRIPNTTRIFPHVTAVLLAVVVLSGCADIGAYISYMWERVTYERVVKEHPVAASQLRLHPEGTYLLRGNISLKRRFQQPVLLAVVTDKFQKREIVRTDILQSPISGYEVFLLEGDYDLYFFADVNADGFFEASEAIGGTLGNTVRVRKPAGDRLTCEGPAISLDPDHPFQSDIDLRVEVKTRDYHLQSLEDELFDDGWAYTGFWHPDDFADHVLRNFFVYGDFNSNKTIVLFVHGVKGTPRVFQYLVEGVDMQRFLPVFYYYPSGLPLQRLGSFLAEAIQNENPFESPPIIVVAHSMGGLVALSALNEICSKETPGYLKGFISFDTPYGGAEGAELSKYAPYKVQLWTDMIHDSEFLTKLKQGKAIKDVPFHLFFGYETGKSSDGDISLQSQLEHNIHLNVLKSYGFNATHEGILTNENCRRQFLKVLDEMSKR